MATTQFLNGNKIIEAMEEDQKNSIKMETLFEKIK
jgi:hypothetical protein